MIATITVLCLGVCAICAGLSARHWLRGEHRLAWTFVGCAWVALIPAWIALTRLP